jgi:xylulokinase
MRLFLGLDISTTAAKAILINEEAAVIASHSEPLQLSQPQPLWSEQDPEAWWLQMAGSIRHVVDQTSGESIVAVGLTGQMHGLVLLNADGKVLRPAILWNDQRTGEQCDEIRARIGRRRLIELTGNDALTGFTAPKILWVKGSEPQVYGMIEQILLPKDFIRYRLTGEFATDLAGASGTLLLDVAHRSWSGEMLEALDIPPKWLPVTYEGTQGTGAIDANAARETGLLEGTPVYAGGGDQSCQAVGVGAVSPEIVALTLGTSGVVFAPMERYVYDQDARLHAFCHALPGQWHLMGVMLSAAGALQWYRDHLSPGMGFEELTQEAKDIAAGAEGLIFLPYLTGERTPHNDPYARGALVGLTSRHSRGHLTRAVLEGVAFGLRDSFELIRAVGVNPTEVRLSGGGARSELWCQILADVLGSSIYTVTNVEGAAYGAALLAAVGVGAFESVMSACEVGIQLENQFTPSADQEVYEAVYPRFKGLYPLLKKQFISIS